MQFGGEIHGPQRMNPDDLGEPLTFPLPPPAGQTFHLSREISSVAPP